MLLPEVAATVLLLAMMSPPPNPPHQITKSRAMEIARKAVAELSSEHKFVVQEDRTIERPFGWVFFYSTAEYAKTRDIKFAVPGAAPIVVLRSNGSVEQLPSSVPPTRAIEIFEKRWRENESAKPKSK